MHDKELFFMREHWKYDPAYKKPQDKNEGLGFDTRLLSYKTFASGGGPKEV